MASTVNHFMSANLVLGLLVVISLDSAVAQVGVCYGWLGNRLPSPCETVGLLDHYNIQKIRIYEADEAALRALSGSNIEVLLGIPNSHLEFLAASQDNAGAWVQNNVIKYPNVKFRYLSVGNEVSPINADTSHYAPFVLPAMKNVYNALSAAGLREQIEVSTTVGTGVLGKSYPPEDGEFRSDVTPYLNPIIEFLGQTDAPFFVNIYPYFSYIFNKAQIKLEYALSQPNSRVGRYDNLFYAILDAVYAALEKSGGEIALQGMSHRKPPKRVVVPESGWPSDGGDAAASLENARIYNNNLIQIAKNGTPKRPGEPIDVYIFAMYDENQKLGDEAERHFGIFLADGQPKYPISFD